MFRKVPFRIIIVSIVVTIAILTFAGIGWYVSGSDGMQFAGVVTSGILTAALVGLYFHQTTLLEDQIDLRTQELNREVRNTHTETLRRRIYAWLGTEDVPQTIDSAEDIFGNSSERLPKVTAVDVKPAEDYIHSYSSPEEFRVIPFGLQDDRYFIDLIENHAPGLKEKKETISDLYSKFDSHRERFKADFEGVSITQESLQMEPDIYLTDWVFSGIVKIERGRSDNWNDEIKPVIRAFEDRAHPSKEHGELRFMEGNRARQSLYYATHGDQTADEISEETARDLAIEALRETVDRIDTDEPPYRDAAKAAETLDLLEEELRELKMELIEYAGRPVFPGDCEYLREAAIDGSERSL